MSTPTSLFAQLWHGEGGPLKQRTRRMTLLDNLIGLGLALATLALLISTPDMGFTRDEGFYFHAAKDYLGWFEELEQNLDNGDTDPSFTQEGIDKHWSYNPEHPVLLKGLFALSYQSFSQERDWLEPSTAMRLPTMVFFAVLIWLLYLFTTDLYGRLAGLFAVGALVAMPRVFFHAHLSCFDVAMMTMWFAVFWAYWKSLASRPWAWVAAILWGISLSTKLNGFFIPGALLLHWAWQGWAEFRLTKEEGTLKLHIPRVPLAFFTMIVLGPLVFYLLWPRHWYDTFPRIAWYIERHLGHEHYAVYYFGDLLAMPPFPVEFPFVMSLYTIPIVTLATFAVGVLALLLYGRVWERLLFIRTRALALLGAQPLLKVVPFVLSHRAPASSRDEVKNAWATRLQKLRPGGVPPAREYPYDPRGTGKLLFLAIFIPFLIISRPDTPIFGGTKHWMTAMPFMSAIAGVGFVWSLNQLLLLVGRKLPLAKRPALRVAVVGLLIVPTLWPALRATVHSHPYGTSYYNELIGGYAGAADQNMHRQFWGYASRAGLEWVNEHAAEKAPIHFHNTLFYSFEMYQEDGLLREDIRNAWSLESAQYVLYHHQRAFHPFLFEIWATYGTMAPVYVASVDGVPMLSIYENPHWKHRR